MTREPSPQGTVIPSRDCDKAAAWGWPLSDLDEKPALHAGTPKLGEVRHLSQVTQPARGWPGLDPGGSEPRSQRVLPPAWPCLPKAPHPLPFTKPLKVTRVRHHIRHRTSKSRNELLTWNGAYQVPKISLSPFPIPHHSILVTTLRDSLLCR